MYGNVPVLEYDPNFLDNGAIYSTTSLKIGNWEICKLLFPPIEICKLNDREFDIAYANYIMNNTLAFMQFFRIIYNLYLGKNVYIIVDFQEWAVNLDESLMKLIQQRYGVNSVLITCDEDYVYAKTHMDCNFDRRFGMQNLLADKEKFTYMISSYRVHNNTDYAANLDGFEICKEDYEYE